MINSLEHYPDPRGGPEDAYDRYKIELGQDAEHIFQELRPLVLTEGCPELLVLLRWKLAERSLVDYAQEMGLSYSTAKSRWRVIKRILRKHYNSLA